MQINISNLKLIKIQILFSFDNKRVYEYLNLKVIKTKLRNNEEGQN